MNLFHRFSFFLIGVFLGIGILFTSIKYRSEPLSFNYFPNNRVKNFLIKNDIFFSRKALCQFECNQLDTVFLKKQISISKVDFQRSKVRSENSNIYYLSSEKMDLIFQTFLDSIVLINMNSHNKDCSNCN